MPQETIGVRFDFDGEVTETDGVYNKFNVQPNAGKLPLTFKNWRDRNEGTHAIMTTALVKKDGATLPGPTWKQFCWRLLTPSEQDRVLMELKRQAKLKRQNFRGFVPYGYLILSTHLHIPLTPKPKLLMDPLSISASIIALIGATHEIVTICYNYAAAAKGAPWALSRMIDELNNLRSVLESIERLCRGGDGTDPATISRLEHIQQLCDAKDGSIAKELGDLMEKLRPPEWANLDGSKRQALMKSLTWPLKEGEAKKTLQNIERMKSNLQLALTADHLAVSVTIRDTQKDEFKILRQSFRSLHDDEKYKKILKWLFAPDPSSNFNAALKRRHSGTGKWLLESQKYQDWKTARGSFLWLHGMPGCGIA
ncbi:MAG: hypothetical protein Q9188_003420 [Gyalolechia gomerana]